MSLNFFISYSRVDKPFAEPFATRLRRIVPRATVWFDDELLGGDIWWEEILNQIEQCDIFVYLLSNESVTSPYCQAEFAEARRLQKQIITVQVRDRTQLTDELGDIQYVDMKAGINDADAVSRLAGAINKQRELVQKRNPLWQPRTPRPKISPETARPAEASDVDTPPLQLPTQIPRSVHLNEESQLAQLHIIESSQTQSLLLRLIRKAEGQPIKFPAIDKTVSVLFEQIERILVSANAVMLVKMALLRPQDDGKFEVIATNPNVSLTAEDTLTATLQWSPDPVGVAGHAIARGDTIRFAHIATDDTEKIWVAITSPIENSIMCIPIRNQLAKKNAPQHEAFLGVLCISCSDEHSLTEEYETFFKKIFIPSFAHIMLFYLLFDRIR